MLSPTLTHLEINIPATCLASDGEISLSQQIMQQSSMILLTNFKPRTLVSTIYSGPIFGDSVIFNSIHVNYYWFNTTTTPLPPIARRGDDTQIDKRNEMAKGNYITKTTPKSILEYLLDMMLLSKCSSRKESVWVWEAIVIV